MASLKGIITALLKSKDNFIFKIVYFWNKYISIINLLRLEYLAK